MPDKSKNYIRRYSILAFIAVVIIIFSVKVFLDELPSKRDAALTKILEQNIRTIRLYPDRGLIYDRHGHILAGNIYEYELYAIPANIKKHLTVNDIDTIISLLQVDSAQIRKNLLKALRTRAVLYKPRLIGTFIPAKRAAYLEEKIYKYPGLYFVKRSIRTYPAHSAAHALGYVRKVDSSDIKADPYYQLNDYIGKRGLEAGYEKYLRGRKGVMRLWVTSNGFVAGKYLGGKHDTLPEAGKKLVSTLDLRLQKYAEWLMRDKPGAIVAIEPKTGEILAFVSSPYYDPNLLTGKQLSKNYLKLAADDMYPLFDRAIQSDKNPPGSTFKLVQALIALQENVINTKTIFICHGGFFYHGISIKCHHHKPVVDFYYSIQTSCNNYYCNVYKRILENPRYSDEHQAYNRWYQYLRQIGIGHRLGIDIPSEAPGSLPDTTTLTISLRKRNWDFHDVVHMSIGQGKIGITPLQLANMVTVIANRGYYITPHLAKRIGDSTLIFPKHYVSIDTSNFTKVIDAMERVFMPGGTAAFSRIPGLQACGKTGTAQNPKGSGKDDNSIFVAFAPKDNPKIAVAVYVEEGGPGSQTAAPIASLIIQKYLFDTIKTPYLYDIRLKNKNIIAKIRKRKNAKKAAHKN